MSDYRIEIQTDTRDPETSSKKVTLPKTNSSHLKMDGRNTIVSFWNGIFSGVNSLLVSGSVIIPEDRPLNLTQNEK